MIKPKEEIEFKFSEAVSNHKKGFYSVAANLYLDILTIKPNHAISHGNLGVLFKQIGDIKSAQKHLSKAISIDPKFIDAFFNLGIIEKELGNVEQSLNHFNSVLRLNPQSQNTLLNIGNLYFENAKHKIALEYFNRSLKIDGNHAPTHLAKGIVLQQLHHYSESIDAYKVALTIDPKLLDANFNLGVIFQTLENYEEALLYYKIAQKIDPNSPDIFNHLGIIYARLERYEQAIENFKMGLSIAPSHASLLSNIGNYYKMVGDNHNALACLSKAQQEDPKNSDILLNLAHASLLHGDFKNGFSGYELRKVKSSLYNYFYNNDTDPSPEWRGQDISKKIILIFAEQGIGDTIQFARYLYILIEKFDVTVIFYVDKKFEKIFKHRGFKIATTSEPLPYHDYHVFLMSLPGILYKIHPQIPKQFNYLSEYGEETKKWSKALGRMKGVKVGLNWQGDPSHQFDSLRSVPLDNFSNLFSINDITFISLQRGYGTEQIESFKYKNKLFTMLSKTDFNHETSFLADTIGMLNQLDLIITVDTALAHLSATLGRPTWVLLPVNPDWRWGLNSNSTPWYTHVKLYRQKHFKKWGPLFSYLRSDLCAFLNL